MVIVRVRLCKVWVGVGVRVSALTIAPAIKGTIIDRQSQTSLFSKLFFSAHSERTPLYYLPIQRLSQKRHIFGKRYNSFLLGINHRRQ